MRAITMTGPGGPEVLVETTRPADLARVLTARQRSIVEWHFFEGLSQGEVARRLGVSQQVVQKAIYGVTRRGRPLGGALRRLREVLTPEQQAIFDTTVVDALTAAQQ